MVCRTEKGTLRALTKGRGKEQNPDVRDTPDLYLALSKSCSEKSFKAHHSTPTRRAHV